MDDDAPAARDHAVDLYRHQASFLVQELRGDLAAREHVYPVVFLVDPQGSLIHMQDGPREESFDLSLISALERQMKLERVLDDRGLGDHLAEHGRTTAGRAKQRSYARSAG